MTEYYEAQESERCKPGKHRTTVAILIVEKNTPILLGILDGA